MSKHLTVPLGDLMRKKDRKKQKRASSGQKTIDEPLTEKEEGTTMNELETQLQETRKENESLNDQLRRAQEQAWAGGAIEPMRNAGDRFEIFERHFYKGAGFVAGSMLVAGSISLMAWGIKKVFGLDGADTTEPG